MTVQWDALLAAFMVVVVVFGRPFLNLVARRRPAPPPEPFTESVETAAEWLLDGYDWDSELEWFLYYEGHYYGRPDWDTSSWLDDAPREGGGA